MKNNSVSKSLKPIMNIFQRYNATIFIVTMVAGLVLAVYTLTSILTAPATSPDLGGNSHNLKGSLDNDTIKRLNNLKSSDQNSSTQTPTTSRISPFSE